MVPIPHEMLVTNQPKERALLMGVETRNADWRITDALEELARLTETVDVEVVGAVSQKLDHPIAATYVGKGKVEEIKDLRESLGYELVIANDELTPSQQRNLEKVLDCKVLDRTGLILDVFARRARTHEGRLQVELAQLEYRMPRLTRMWTHLSRQAVGGVGLRGPGETQLESDRREIGKRIAFIKDQLSHVHTHRQLYRDRRKQTRTPVAALVGYTNAGKSTLLNTLTGAGVLAEDMLFATLDPTLRRVRLPHGTVIILSDTVGFISDLPTHLVAAFRATLEEVVEADVIIHLRDISDPDTAAQAMDVEHILADLGVDAQNHQRVVEVWNKVDRLDEASRERMLDAEGRTPVAISAVTGEGIDALVALIEERVAGMLEPVTVTLAPSQLGQVDWLYRNGEVIGREDNDDGSVTLSLRATETARRLIEERLTKRPAG